MAAALSLVPVSWAVLSPGTSIGQIEAAGQTFSPPQGEESDSDAPLERPAVEAESFPTPAMVKEIPIDAPKPQPAPEEPSNFELVRAFEAIEPPRTFSLAQPLRTAESSPAVKQAGHAPSTESSSGGGGVLGAPILVTWEVPRQVRKRFKGRVIALIELNGEGRAVRVSLSQGTNSTDLDAALINALYAARYAPATEDGRSVKSTLRQPIDFE